MSPLGPCLPLRATERRRRVVRRKREACRRVSMPRMEQPSMNTKQLIGDRAVSGEGPSEKILDPATGQVIAEVNEASLEQVALATRAAQQAFAGWAATVPRD